MKILIVSSYFPPENTIAALRPYSWAKWWSKVGHEVTVITTKKKKMAYDLNFDCSGFNVISLPIPFLSNASSLYRNSSVKSKKNFSKLLLSFLKKSCLFFAGKTGCFFFCRFPDFHDLWARYAIKEISGLFFDLVISTGWPYSVHRIGLAIKKKNPETKWIVDWRDLWTHNHMHKGLKIFWFYERYLENKFHDNANLITTVSEPLADKLKSMTRTDVEVIYNGYDSDDYIDIKQKPRKNNEPFTIVYTGKIFYKGYQDPSPLFEAVSNLKRKKILIENALKLVFAGSGSDTNALVKKYNISEYYSYLGFLPRKDALQLQYDADAVLLLEFNHPSVSGILTGKLFEYLYIAREIIAIGKNEITSAGKLINNANAGICFGSDVRKIEEYLINKIGNKKAGLNVEKNEILIKKFERKKQAMKILECLDKRYNSI